MQPEASFLGEVTVHPRFVPRKVIGVNLVPGQILVSTRTERRQDYLKHQSRLGLGFASGSTGRHRLPLLSTPD